MLAGQPGGAECIITVPPCNLLVVNVLRNMGSIQLEKRRFFSFILGISWLLVLVPFTKGNGGCNRNGAANGVAEVSCGDHDAETEATASGRRKLRTLEELGLSDAEEQIIGKRWNYQQRFDPERLNAQQWMADIYRLPPEVCDRDDNHKQLLNQVELWGGAAKKTPRIFCGVYTHEKNHDTKIKAIKETWATRCDGFVAFSDTLDQGVPTFKIKHEGPEEWNNMWQKSRAIWKYIGFHYKDDFDWFLLGGDDIFIILENLRKYLLSEEIKIAAGGLKNGGTNPMYLGRRFRPQGDDSKIFNSGGAAYVLNQAAVTILTDHIDDEACEPHRKCSWEDVQVARCLRIQGVEAYDTKDCYGRERFHPFTPAHHLSYRIPKKPDWYQEYSIGLKIGPGCCSRDSLSFHYVDPELMRRIYHLVYSCPKGPSLLVGETDRANIA